MAIWLKFQKIDINRDSNMAPSMTSPPPTPLGGCQNPLHPLSDNENLTIMTGTVSVVKNSQMMSLLSQKNDTIQWYHIFKQCSCMIMSGSGFVFPMFFINLTGYELGWQKKMIPLEQK